MRKFPRAKRQNKKATTDEILSPSFLAKRAPGGKSDKKPEGWEPSAGSQERVRYMNGLDVDLYAWAATRELERLKETAAAASEGLPVPGETWAGVEDF